MGMVTGHKGLGWDATYACSLGLLQSAGHEDLEAERKLVVCDGFACDIA